MSSDIKVSVCVVTYNHEKYIAECLQSLVDQVTDFPFEIVVGEDCSTDNTRGIVETFAQKYPDLIVRNYHNNNVGAVQNAITSYKMARGKYICHVDGDDLALPGKLQIQADVLDKNSGCVICSHDMEIISHDGSALNKTFKRHGKIKNTILDLYETLPFFAHSSKMFVNNLDKKFWCQLHPQALDIEVHAQQAKYGYIYHVDKPFGVYRIGAGVSANIVASVNPLIVAGNERVFMDAFESYKEKAAILKTYYARSLMNYAYQSAVLGDECGYIAYIRKSVSIKLFSAVQAIMFMFSFMPRVAVFISKKRNEARFK